MNKRERNPIYAERPEPRAARKVWDALITAGFQKINLWFEDIGNALEMCGPTGGWQFQDKDGDGEWLGYDSTAAVERALELGRKHAKQAAQPELMYRYEDVAYAAPFDETGTLPGTVKVELRTFKLIRRTPKGFWVALAAGSFIGCTRFVLAGARRKFACPTIAEARTSFIARKRRQAGIYKARLDRALWAIAEVQKTTDK